MSYKVLVTEEIDKAGMNYLINNGYDIKMGTGIEEDTVVREISDCDAVLTRNAIINERVMKASPKLKVISMHGVGVDNIDVETATRLGIQVTNAAGSNKVSVAEYTIGLLIDLAKNIPLFDHELRKGNWSVRRKLGLDLEGKTLGIIGMGNIGSLVAKKAALGLGMNVIAYKRHAAVSDIENVEITTDFDRVIKSADFLSIHVPSVASTKKLIGKRELSMMKPDAFLINTARGDVIDNEALTEALKENKIAGAAVDVFVGEVPDMNDPMLHLPNIIVTPHTAAYSKESVMRMSLYSAIGVDEALKGKKITNPINTIGKKAEKEGRIDCSVLSAVTA